MQTLRTHRQVRCRLLAEKVVTEKTFIESLDAATKEARRMDAPLSVRLQAVADKERELSTPFADIVDRMVARLAENGVGLAAPRPGETMPHFLLPDEAGRLVSLSSLLEKGPVVVSFNRGHWCPYCQYLDAAHSRDLRRRL